MVEQNPFLVATDPRLKKIYDELENEAYDEKQHTYDYKITNQIIRANFTKLLEAQTDKGGQAEVLVMPKIADIIKFISDWGCLDKAPCGEFEQMEDKTLRRLIKAIESNFTA
ncbi:MAG: hypothetical protein WC974_08425 [Thermoplasmata archaeon]